MLDLEPIKDRLASATPGPWESAELQGQSRRNSFFSVAVVGRREVRAGIPCQAQPDECDANLIANAPTDLAALVAEVERLRDDNHSLQAEVILTLDQHERIREAVARHRVQILEGGHPLAEDVMLWAVLDA